MSGKKRDPSGYNPALPAKLTIEEVERLFMIFKQSGPMTTSDMDAIKAIGLLNRQLEELNTLITALNYQNPKFKVWRDTTISVLKRVLAPDSPHLIRFRDLRFSGPSVIRTDWSGPRVPDDYISPEDTAAFQKACQTSRQSLQAAIKEIEDFGVYVEKPTQSVPTRSRGMNQTFHGPVTIHNQAIATDDAIQKIGQMGNTGVSLKEIARLLQESMELTGRQVQEGLAGIQGLASEVEKPEDRRNWKSILDCGEKVLGIAGKATDLASKLASYIPHVVTLVEQAKHWLK